MFNSRDVNKLFELLNKHVSQPVKQNYPKQKSKKKKDKIKTTITRFRIPQMKKKPKPKVTIRKKIVEVRKVFPAAPSTAFCCRFVPGTIAVSLLSLPWRPPQ